MTQNTTVGIVGAGNRVKSFYAPILKQLDGFEIAGFTARTEKTRENFEKESGIASFDSVASLCEESPDFIIVCVRSSSLREVLEPILERNIPFLVETPVEDLSLAQEIANSNVKAGVVEQWPYLPIEQFKKMLINRGLVGDVFIVENDCRLFDYHGIAQIRQYLARGITPRYLSAVTTARYLPEFLDSNGESKNLLENWDIGFIKFSDDSVLLHKFSYNCKVAPFRPLQSVRIIGTSGSIITACIDSKNNDFEIFKVHCNINGETHSLPVQIDRDGQIIKRIVCEVPDAEPVVWENKFIDKNFDRHSVGIATHIVEMKNYIDNKRATPLYGFADVFTDMVILYGIKQSGQTGQPIGFK